MLSSPQTIINPAFFLERTRLGSSSAASTHPGSPRDNGTDWDILLSPGLYGIVVSCWQPQFHPLPAAGWSLTASSVPVRAGEEMLGKLPSTQAPGMRDGGMEGMGGMGTDCPWINPKMALGVHSGPCPCRGWRELAQGDTASKNPELNPTLALPDSRGGSSSEPHPGLTLEPFWLCLCTHSPSVRTASYSHPIPDIPVWNRGPTTCPLPSGSIPAAPRGTGALQRQSSSRKETLRTPADLSCNLGLPRPGFIFRPPGGEARRKEPCNL